MDLQDKVVIVTGASRGIGRQIALALGRRGAKVVVAARTVETRPTLPGTVGQTVALIEEAGGTAVAVACDVTEVADLERLVATTIATFGRLDVVVNNAADMAGEDLETLVTRMITRPVDQAPPGAGGSTPAAQPAGRAAPAAQDPYGNWFRQFATNVHAPFVLMSLAVPHLRARGGGVVVNITSGSAEPVDVAWLMSLPGRERMRRNDRVGYATTKAALNRLTNAAAADLAADNIAVVAVDPGTTRTEVAELLGAHGLLDPDDFGPMSLPVALVLDLLTSEDPMAFTGQVVRAHQA